jgi:UTP--glucose-1-phosphate uridylyltransferase
MKQLIKKAIIPVAGLGTRMLPATKAIPKELLPVFDKPLIEHVVKEAISSGITEIILVTRSGKESIENHFDANYELEHRLEKNNKGNILGTVKNILPKNIKLVSIRQSDALGLGHAVLCAKHLINNEPFAILLPDVLVHDKKKYKDNYSFSKLVESWNNTGIGQVMVEKVRIEKIDNYGIADFGNVKCKPFKSTSLRGVVEKPSPKNAPSDLAIIGRYILPFTVFDFLEKVNIGVGGEIQLTDALDELIKFEGLNALETDATIFDCGDKKGFLSANLALGMRDDATKKEIEILFKKIITDK